MKNRGRGGANWNLPNIIATGATTIAPLESALTKNTQGGVPPNICATLRFRHHMRHVAPLSPVASVDCAYFPSPRGCGLQRFQNTLATTPLANEVQLFTPGVRYPLLRDLRDENGVRLHGQSIRHTGQRLVEAGEQYAELRRCKAERREIKADLLVGCGHVQHHEDGFVLVATEIRKRVGVIFVDRNVAAV